MPIFMDRHDIPGVSAKDVAEAHQKDLVIQEKFGCRAITYWYDEDQGMAFCLIEAPDKDSVQQLHNYAHGLIPNQIIEVEPKTVESFLGRIKDPVEQNGSETLVINDPAFRALVVVYEHSIPAKNVQQPKGVNGKQEGIKERFRDAINDHQGKEVEHSHDCSMASFVSVKQAVACANQIQNKNRRSRIGVSAGVPVSDDHLFFGKTVSLARRLGMIAQPGQIRLASLVSDLLKASSNFGKIDEPFIGLNPLQEAFVNQAMEIIEKNACEPGFDVRAFSDEMAMSKSQLYRKLTTVIGYAPNDFIKEYRLNTALRLIDKQHGNISEIAYQSGFSSLSYFSKCFLNRFDVLPSHYSNAI